MRIDVLQVVRESVLYSKFECKDQRNYDALVRLCESEVAKHAWLAIHDELVLANEVGEFTTLASMVGHEAAVAMFDPPKVQTKRQIREVGEEAAKLAERLCELICTKASLDLDRVELQSEDEANALVVVQSVVKELVKDSQTNEALANWLATRKARSRGVVVMGLVGPWIDRCDEVKPAELRTSGDWALEAVETLDAKIGWSNLGFIERLRNFAEFAKRTVDDEPVVPNPNTAKVGQRAFANQVSYWTREILGSPRAGIVAALASAVFDDDVDEENVKRWWQRCTWRASSKMGR